MTPYQLKRTTDDGDGDDEKREILSTAKEKESVCSFQRARTVKVNGFSISLSTPADLSSFSLNLK